MIKTLGIIQARMQSVRLPKKVLLPLGEMTVLEWVFHRCLRSKLVDHWVLATSSLKADDPIVQHFNTKLITEKTSLFRGDEEDVLDRFFQASKAFPTATQIVRICADSPFIDPEIIDQVIRKREESAADYCSNSLSLTFPLGLNVECFTSRALKTAQKGARSMADRVHVTPFIYQHPDKFSLSELKHHTDLSENRWTLDTLDDFEFFKKCLPLINYRDDFKWEELLKMLDAQPEIKSINKHIRQKKLSDL